MTLRLNGSTSGYVELDCPDIGGNNNIKLPASNGSANNLLKNSGTAGTLEFASNVNIDSSGRLLVGTSSALSNINRYGGATTPVQQIVSNATSTWNTGLGLINYSASGYAPVLTLGLSASNTAGTNTLVASGDRCGVISFNGNDGTDFEEAARIEAFVDGTPGANDMPGRLVFSTTADGASSPTERMRINSVGAAKFTTDGTVPASASGAHAFRITSNSDGVIEAYSAASSTPYGYFYQSTAADPNNTSQYVFKAVQNTGVNVYSIWSNGTVTARSDVRYKKNIEATRDGYLEDIAQLRVVKYNWYNHDEGAPKELGFIAQEVEQVFPGLVLSEPEKDEDGNETGEFCKSIKTSVFTPMLVKALQEAYAKIEAMEARLSALEAS